MPLSLFLSKFVLLTTLAAVVAGQQGRTSTHPARPAEWVIPNSYRIVVRVDPGLVKRSQTPVSLNVNFDEILRARDIKGRVDQHSIRVVRFNPDSGPALPYVDSNSSYSVPYQLSREFFYGDAGKIWWRLRDEKDQHFHVYFDVLGAHGVKDEPHTVALVGVGDNFLFNNGKPGPLDVSYSSAMRIVDWDGDGLRDLIIGSHQTQEYGVYFDEIGGVPKFLNFFKNIGTKVQPLFAPGYQIKGEKDAYVQKPLGGGPSAFELYDWNGDGKLDVISRNGDASALYMYQNTGKRDGRNLPILMAPQEVFRVNVTASQLLNTPGPDQADDYYRKNFKMVDWDGDGNQDLLFSIIQNHRSDEDCDSTKKVCYYDAKRKFFEVHKNRGRDANGRLIFAPPTIVRVAVGSGAPLSVFGFELGEYVDWTGDGKPDLMTGDMQSDPLGASRMLLFENIVTRSTPKFLIPRPILSRVEDFDTDPTPVAVDWDDDGDVDLLMSGYQGWAKVYKNVGVDSDGLPRLDGGEFVQQTHPKITGGKQTRTVAADWNGDGLMDLVQGGINGWVTWYENSGTNIDPVFKPEVKLQAEGQAIRFINGLRDNPQSPSEPNAGYTALVVVDFDRDGDLDLIVGDMRGYQTYFENRGSRRQPELAAGRRIEADGVARSFGWRNQLGVGDLDGDGDLEIVTTAYTDRRLNIYKVSQAQNDPKTLRVSKSSTVKLESGAELLPAHAGGNNNGDYMTKMVDWDGDGDLDILLGTLYDVWYYENVGSKQVPTFKPHDEITVEGRPLMVSGHAGSIDAVDWNGDGKVDIIIGGESGWTFYFERTFLEGKLAHAEIKKVEARL